MHLLSLLLSLKWSFPLFGYMFAHKVTVLVYLFLENGKLNALVGAYFLKCGNVLDIQSGCVFMRLFTSGKACNLFFLSQKGMISRKPWRMIQITAHK